MSLKMLDLADNKVYFFIYRIYKHNNRVIILIITWIYTSLLKFLTFVRLRTIGQILQIQKKYTIISFLSKYVGLIMGHT